MICPYYGLWLTVWPFFTWGEFVKSVRSSGSISHLFTPYEKKILILLYGPNKNRMRFMPPLNINRELLNDVLLTLKIENRKN